MGDFALLVDENASAYVAYDAWHNDHRVRVERLAPDWASSMQAKLQVTSYNMYMLLQGALAPNWASSMQACLE